MDWFLWQDSYRSVLSYHGFVCVVMAVCLSTGHYEGFCPIERACAVHHTAHFAQLLLCAPVLIAVPSEKAWILSLSSGDFPLCNPSEQANGNFREEGRVKKGGKINLIPGSPVRRMTWASQRNDCYFRFCARHKRGSSYSISIYSEILISLLPSHLYCIYYLKFSPQAQSLVQQSLSWTVVKWFGCLMYLLACHPITAHTEKKNHWFQISSTLDINNTV